jgi:hypothetical protein
VSKADAGTLMSRSKKLWLWFEQADNLEKIRFVVGGIVAVGGSSRIVSPNRQTQFENCRGRANIGVAITPDDV